MTRYSKDAKGVDLYYLPDDLYKYAGEPFDVRVSILDESVDGALWVQVPEDDISRSIGELLDDYVIGREQKQTEFIRDTLLELEEFPYLSDALDWVADIWHRFRNDDATLDICVNHGPANISLEDTAREHMSTCVWQDGSFDYMMLDLVFEPGDMTLLGMLGDRQFEFLQWMKGTIALYKLDTEGGTEKLLRKKEEAEEAREQLFFHALIEKDSRGRLQISQKGRKSIGQLIEEQEDVLARFDVFRDVVVRRKEGELTAQFGTLAGADYRIAVYEHEEVDAFRAIFLLTLLSGDLDEELQGKGWLKVINDVHFYEGLLAPAMDRASLEPDELAELIVQGKQYLARTQAVRQRAGYSQQVLQRAQTVQAFPRPEGKRSETKRGKDFQKASENQPSDELGAPPLPGDDEVVDGLLPPANAEEGREAEPDQAPRESQPPPMKPPTGPRTRRPFRQGAQQGQPGGPPGPPPDQPPDQPDGDQPEHRPPPMQPPGQRPRSTRPFRQGAQGPARRRTILVPRRNAPGRKPLGRPPGGDDKSDKK